MRPRSIRSVDIGIESRVGIVTNLESRLKLDRDQDSALLGRSFSIRYLIPYHRADNASATLLGLRVSTGGIDHLRFKHYRSISLWSRYHCLGVIKGSGVCPRTPLRLSPGRFHFDVK
ncbi:hypothetical protein EVAR_9322_1 [Eumeta japonica]|uniref:Uncharacterized protein n=1 Tax=Eumeta variegata TaxID=151549 RepID=A0A4C1TNU5_EUMVA|nr:hypothetical protein EVAR_9322_1 [Eumeta japonica]